MTTVHTERLPDGVVATIRNVCGRYLVTLAGALVADHATEREALDLVADERKHATVRASRIRKPNP